MEATGKRLLDVSFGEILRQIAYKSEVVGIDLIVADRWFPSSKTCSSCGWKKDDLSPSDREFVCEVCGVAIDRDLNAAINLKQYGTASSAGTLTPVDIRPLSSEEISGGKSDG